MNLYNLFVVEFIQYAIRQRAVFAEKASFNIPIIVPFKSTTLYCCSFGYPWCPRRDFDVRDECSLADNSSMKDTTIQVLGAPGVPDMTLMCAR
jgi:hypothetical protein